MRKRIEILFWAAEGIFWVGSILLTLCFVPLYGPYAFRDLFPSTWDKKLKPLSNWMLAVPVASIFSSSSTSSSSPVAPLQTCRASSITTRLLMPIDAHSDNSVRAILVPVMPEPMMTMSADLGNTLERLSTRSGNGGCNNQKDSVGFGTGIPGLVLRRDCKALSRVLSSATVLRSALIPKYVSRMVEIRVVIMER